jgi:alpha-tubulin suppressor-like RCC1 family protein
VRITGVAGLPTRSLAAGRQHGLAVRPDGRLLAWGDNANGQLGDGTIAPRRTPTLIGTSQAWVQVAGGSYGHSLGLQADGTLWAWGYNIAGQLGDGTTTQRNAPVQVGTARLWRQVWAGEAFTLALAADGTLWAWGNNGVGQLGTGTGLDSAVPVAVSGGATWRAAGTGTDYAAAVRADGTLWLWGNNIFGQLGDGTTTRRNAPAQLGTATSWVAAAASNHTLALQANGTLYAWGYNGSGQLGNGTLVSRPIPAQVGTSTAWTQLAVGGGFSVALQANGTLWSWGNNFDGELGDNTTVDRTAPTREVTLGTTWLVVATGQSHALARTSNGYALASTGYNHVGQLGDGTLTTALRYDHALVALPVRPAGGGPAALTLYPNPANGRATLTGTLPGTAVQVLDATGRLVATATADAAGTAVLPLSAGVYVVRAGSKAVRLTVE